MREEVARVALQIVLAGVVTLLVWLLDGPLFGAELHWSVCVAIGLVVVFGGVLILHLADDV